jgi:hypothetical protein
VGKDVKDDIPACLYEIYYSGAQSLRVMKSCLNTVATSDILKLGVWGRDLPGPFFHIEFKTKYEKPLPSPVSSSQCTYFIFSRFLAGAWYTGLHCKE